MNTKMIYVVEDYELYQLPNAPQDVIDLLNDWISKIPEEYRSRALLSFHGSSYPVTIDLSYERPYTEQEILEERFRVQKLQDAREREERETYEKLRRKYEIQHPSD